MKTLLRGTVIATVLLMLAVPLFAGGAQEPDFLSQLEEAQAIAQGLVQAREGSDLTPGEQAELARELARNAERLDDEGYSRSQVAEATLQAVEQLREQIQAWHDGDQEEPLGETVRNTVSETAREAARNRETNGADDQEEGEVPEDAGDQVPEDRPSGSDAADQAGDNAGAGNR